MALVTIDGFSVDITRLEDHSFESEVTEHPVEEGVDITDHVRRKPIKLSMECVVSDSPVGPVRDLRNRVTTKPSEDAFAKMLAIREAGEPVTVATSLKVFNNMLLTNLGVPRTAANGRALVFTVTFVQIEFVTNARTTVRVNLPRGQNKRSLGGKQLKEAAIAGFTPTLRAVTNLGRQFGIGGDE